MFTVMEEVQDKIEANPKASVLPLNADIEGWDIVFAGDWMYQYKEYEREPSVQTCSITQNNERGQRVDRTTLRNA